MAVNANWKGIRVKTDNGRDAPQATISQYPPQLTVAKGGLNVTTNLEEGDHERDKVGS